jgi:fluoride ion exporter CrcB/FEX
MSKILLIAAGCLFIGPPAAEFAEPVLPGEEYMAGVMIGERRECPAVSSFGVESLILINERQFRDAAANGVVSGVLGPAAARLGYRAAEPWLGA